MIFKNKARRGDFPQTCGFCEHSSALHGGEEMLCRKKGVVDAGYSCRKFVYDPLKRVPSPVRKLPAFSKEDLIL